MLDMPGATSRLIVDGIDVRNLIFEFNKSASHHIPDVIELMSKIFKLSFNFNLKTCDTRLKTQAGRGAKHSSFQAIFSIL